MKTVSLSTIKAIVKNTKATGDVVLSIDARQDRMRVRYPNGREWTLYLSILAERLNGKQR